MPRGRNASLLAAGLLVTHELRYLVGYGGHAETAMAAQGHAYLSFAAVAVLAGLLVAGARLAAALRRARRTGACEGGRVGVLAAWASSSVTLALAYVAQESLEGILDPGHPAGLGGVVGHGGWVAFLLAIAVGLVVALLRRGAGAAIARAARRGLRAPPRRSPTFKAQLPQGRRPGSAPLARNLAGRAPPRPSSA